MSQAVNAWRNLPSSAEAAQAADGATRPSQDIRSTVGLTGVTTVSSPAAQSHCAPATASASGARAPKAAAAADSDSDDSLELVGEQSLDEVLEVSLCRKCLLVLFLYLHPLYVLSAV